MSRHFFNNYGCADCIEIENLNLFNNYQLDNFSLSVYKNLRVLNIGYDPSDRFSDHHISEECIKGCPLIEELTCCNNNKIMDLNFLKNLIFLFVK